MRSNSEVVLNEEQQAVVDARDGVFTVIASAGSGKTTVLAHRYLKMLMGGVPSKSMLSLTFTNAAASEIASRVGILDADSVFRTFHSLAIEILKKERDLLPFKLSETIIPVMQEEYQLFFDLAKIYPACSWRIIQEKITAWKCADILPDQAIEESRNSGIEYFYALSYLEYERKSRERGFLDFDSVLRETVNLLSTNEEVRNRWKRKYISIDEAQDTDAVQVELIRLLFDGNVMICGDFNQCIFEWRSARPNSLTDFVKTLPNHKVLYLGQNFRSTKKLVSFFREILPVDNGILSVMRSENEDGESPSFVKYDSPEQEAEEVLKAASDPHNTAILARTNRQLFTIQRACLQKGIKYKILGRRDFFEQNEIKKVLDFAKKSDGDQQAHLALSNLIKEHNLFYIYRNSETAESNPIENLNNLVKMSAGKGSLSQFLTWLRKLAYARRSSKGIALSTGHQAKGRQWNNVFIIGVKQGILPHQKSDMVEEEKRIWFVMCTRSAKKLAISFYDNPSQFLNNYLDRVEDRTEESDGRTLRQHEG